MVESIEPRGRVTVPGTIEIRVPNFLTSLAGGLKDWRDRIMSGRGSINGTQEEVVSNGSSLTPPTTVELLSQENNRGVVRFPSGGDTIVVFQGKSYLENLPYLIRVATIFLHRNVGWDEEFCQQLMVKGMSVEGLLPLGAELDEKNIARILARREREVPSVFLYRDEKTPPAYKEEALPSGEYAEYFGISIQKKLFLKTELAGEVSVLDHVLRVFEPSARGHERGRTSVAWALVRHGGARFYIHKTGNPIAKHTNRKSPYLIQEGAHPISSLNISDPLMREVRGKTTPLILLPGRVMLPNGVIKGDYPFPNEGFDVQELRGGALEMYHRMKSELGMHIDYSDGYNGEENFDSVAPLYMVR